MAEDKEMGIPVKVDKDDEPVRVTDRRFWAQADCKASDTSESSYSFKPAYVEELEKKVADSQRRADEVLAAHREYKADIAGETQRARERIQNEYDRRLSQAKTDLVRKFVEVLENLERALGATRTNPTFDSFLDGVQLIRNQFVATLAELGVSELEVKGKPFDPEMAEAIGTVEVYFEAEDQLVIEVVGKGYILGQALLRPARVRVGRYVPTAAREASTP